MLKELSDKLMPPNRSEDECYKAGFSCGLHGANETNCHFALFATKAKMEQWAEGKRAGEAAKGARDHEHEQSTLQRVSQERLARIAVLEERLVALRQAMPKYGWEDLVEDRAEVESWFDESGSHCT